MEGARLVVYRGGEETARIIAGLIEAERECCPFVGFNVESTADEVRLTLSFPSEAGSTVAELGLGTPA